MTSINLTNNHIHFKGVVAISEVLKVPAFLEWLKITINGKIPSSITPNSIDSQRSNLIFESLVLFTSHTIPGSSENLRIQHEQRDEKGEMSFPRKD
jgi:hypothetical protein